METHKKLIYFNVNGQKEWEIMIIDTTFTNVKQKSMWDIQIPNLYE